MKSIDDVLAELCGYIRNGFYWATRDGNIVYKAENPEYLSISERFELWSPSSGNRRHLDRCYGAMSPSQRYAYDKLLASHELNPLVKPSEYFAALMIQAIKHNQPMPRGGARPGSGPKPRPPEQLRSVTFTTRCTPAEKLLYDAFKTELDVEYQGTKKPSK